MKWKFWQKKKTVGQERLRRLEIPADKVQKIRRLSDAYLSIPGGADKEAYFLIWSAIAGIFPEVRRGQWSLEFVGAFGVAVVECPPSPKSK